MDALVPYSVLGMLRFFWSKLFAGGKGGTLLQTRVQPLRQQVLEREELSSRLFPPFFRCLLDRTPLDPLPPPDKTRCVT